MMVSSNLVKSVSVYSLVTIMVIIMMMVMMFGGRNWNREKEGNFLDPVTMTTTTTSAVHSVSYHNYVT